jgi:hypothetical protein
MSQFLYCDMRRPKAFPEERLRMSTFFRQLGRFHDRTNNRRSFGGVVADKPRIPICGAMRRSAIVSWLGKQCSLETCFNT